LPAAGATQAKNGGYYFSLAFIANIV